MADFLSLHTALSGILAARAGVETTSHNVSNAHSEGYTRQRVSQLSREYGHAASYGTVGTGTTVDGIMRARNEFLDMRVRAGLGTAAGLGTRASLMSRIEDALAEPELGIGSALSKTWSAFEELSLDPTDPAARRNVIATLDSLATRINSIAGSWEQVGADAQTSAHQTTSEVNRLLDEVAGLNEAIRRSSGLSTPNDLFDRRDLALDRLAELVGATSRDMPDGTVRVSVHGVSLVQGEVVSKLSWEADTATVAHPALSEPITVGGALAEYHRFLAIELPERQATFDGFVSELADALNDAHRAGMTVDGSPGTDLFAYDPMSPARTLTLTMDDPVGLAAASTVDFAVHDGSNAAAIAALRDRPAIGFGDRSVGQAWREIVTDIGVATATAADAAAAQQGLQKAAELARMGTHGVSVDEEMVSLIEYQHAYQASARIMTAVDELLEVLIARTGIVGR